MKQKKRQNSYGKCQETAKEAKSLECGSVDLLNVEVTIHLGPAGCKNSETPVTAGLSGQL